MYACRPELAPARGREADVLTKYSPSMTANDLPEASSTDACVHICDLGLERCVAHEVGEDTRTMYRWGAGDTERRTPLFDFVVPCYLEPHLVGDMCNFY